MTKPDPIIGTTIGGVQILEKLGSGGMGAVYLGLQTSLNRKVAVKILPVHLSKDAEYITRFSREASTAGKLEHPNIVSVYDIGHADDRYYIVMQYVEGESLQSIIDVMGTLSYTDAVKVTIGILAGLQHAHESGIIHRDIKPDNILVTPSNQPKILDFGLAITTDGQLKLTETNTVVGTPYFISTEQARGKPAEPRSDIYSTGVTLYYLLTGRLPFTGQNALAILNMHIHEMPVAPGNLNPRIPPALSDIVLKMMAKNPTERYKSAAAASKDLEAFLQGRTVVVKVPTAPYGKRTQFLAYATGAVGALLLAGTLMVALQGKTTDPPKATKGPGVPPVDDWQLTDVSKSVQDILKEATDQGKEHLTVYSACLTKLDALQTRFAYRKDLVMMIAAGKKSITDAAEVHAKNILDPLRPRIELARKERDYFLVQNIYREFPKHLLEITETGRFVQKDQLANDAATLAWIVETLEKAVPQLVEREDFEEANLQIEALLQNAPLEYANRVKTTRDMMDATAAEKLEQVLPRLGQEVADLQTAVTDILSTRRQSDASWDGLLAFVDKYPRKKMAFALLKPCRVPYATMRDFVPSKAGEAEIETLLQRIEKDQAPADEDLIPGYLQRILNDGSGDAGARKNVARMPGNRLRTLMEDVLRWEWLRRRAEKGVRRIGGTPIALETLGRGKIVPGPADLHSFVPETGPAQPFRISELPQRDLAFLACAAENGAEGPVDKALRTPEQARLCLATGIGHYYSSEPDHYTLAQKWILQARANGLPVPTFRSDDLELFVELEQEQMGQDYLRKAHEHAAAKRFDKAHAALDLIAKEHEAKPYFETLQPILFRHRARFILDDADQAMQKKEWARVKELIRKLMKDHEGYEPERAQRLYNLALLNTGKWSSSFATSLKAWDWDGEGSTKCPVKSDGGSLRFTDEGKYRALYMDRSKTEGVTGFRAKVRLNQQQQSFDFSLLFDGKEMMGDTRKFVLKSSGHVELLERKSDKWGVETTADLAMKPKAQETYELAIVSDGSRTVFFFGSAGNLQPVFTLLEAMDPKKLLGITATADSTFTDILLRDVK